MPEVAQSVVRFVEEKKMQKTYAIAGIAVIAALLGGTWLATQRGGDDENIFAQCTNGAVAGGDIGGPFTLVSETGETVTDEDVITGPTLIYFGYTFCPDVCPIHSQRNALAVQDLEDKGIMVTPVFISVDPERDTPEMLAEFTYNFHDRMLGLTGTPEQVKAASDAYRNYYARGEGDDEFYLVDHMTNTYFMMPPYGFLDFYEGDMSPEDMSASLECFITAAEEA